MLLTAIAVYSANSTFWLETWPHDCGVMFTVSQEEGVLFEQLFCDAPFGANEHRAASFQRTIDCLEVDTNRLPMIDDRCDFAFSRHEAFSGSVDNSVYTWTLPATNALSGLFGIRYNAI